MVTHSIIPLNPEGTASGLPSSSRFRYHFARFSTRKISRMQVKNKETTFFVMEMSKGLVWLPLPSFSTIFPADLPSVAIENPLYVPDSSRLEERNTNHPRSLLRTMTGKGRLMCLSPISKKCQW